MNFNYEYSQISRKELIKTAKKLSPYIETLNKVAKSQNYDLDEGSINLPFDEEVLGTVERLKKKVVSKKLKYVIVIGIGGSNLGAKAVYSAINGYFDVVEPNRYPKMIFLDTNDPRLIHKLMTLMASIKEPKEVLITAISKSGKTAETTANLEVLMNRFPNLKDRLVVITDANSTLWDKDTNRLGMPDKVGGRYSILSTVGLFPLSAAGINILSLREGAGKVRKKCLEKDPEKNIAALSASIAYLNFINGRNISDSFFFNSELEDLGKWYRQLAGESLGKEGTGFTPTVSIGSTDLHSVGQLYLGGKADKFFTFVWAQKESLDIKIAKKSAIPMAVPEIRGRSLSDIKTAILKGVKESYRKKKLPFTELILDDISEFSIGEFMQFKMIETMMVAQLLGVNSFDQPNVEDYKVETKKILAQN